MFIQELILEGFKSYATRTTVSGWDNEFNAITGLNGSGKSNILDAICFVLGISSLSHVRATSLHDLVYKKGQAGITKASVTIIFDNQDRTKSPLGYENCKQISITRQIIIGGRNKYIVNGHNKNQQDVANLFQSVQLNVNNPHFLIMQGKITKVLNMKPPEILSMIEEAAGTRMFEDRKEKALKTMEKKDSKLAEITSILENEIAPKFSKLREAKRSFLEFQKLDTELGFLKRFISASEYVKYDDALKNGESRINSVNARINNMEQSSKYLISDISELDIKINKIMEQRTKNGGKFQELESEFKQFSKTLVITKTQLDLNSTSINDEIKNQEKIILAQADVSKQIETGKFEYKRILDECTSSQEDFEKKTKEIQKLEELLETLSVGLSASEGQDNGYMDQLRDAKKLGCVATSEAEQAKLRIAHLKKDLAELAPKVKSAEKEFTVLNANIKDSQQMIQNLKNDIQNVEFDPNREEEVKKQLNIEETLISELERKMEELERSLQGLSFKYTNPSSSFDRSKVKGLVAELIKLPKENINAAVALEVCAGGKLYNVVVESEMIGTQLLQKGQLKKRVTIIPLNKISAFKVHADRISTAKKITSGSADLALNLIGYDEELLPAMSYVFGSTLICKDPATAKSATFHKDVRMRSVTLEGDTYDPSGQLSGGSRPNSAGILLRMGEVSSLRSKLSSLEIKRSNLLAELDEIQLKSKHYQGLVQALELKEHSFKLMEERLSSNANSQLIKRYEDLNSQLEIQKEALVVANKKRTEAAENCKSIEAEMKDFSKDRDAKLKSLQLQITKGKAELAKAGPNVSNIQLQIDMAKEEVVQLEKEYENLNMQLNFSKEAINSLTSEKSKLLSEFEVRQTEYDNAEKALKDEKKSLASFDKETEVYEKEKREKKQELENIKIESQSIKHDLERLVSDCETAAAQLKSIVSANPWIPDQKQNFGKANTDFDFSGKDIKESIKRMTQIEASHSKLRKSLDEDVMQKYDRLEKKEGTLKQMFSTVKKDKKMIQETITSLDQYKIEALLKTWRQVNSDFGMIFGDLLPGNSAKLDPPEGKEITDGLEVKVCLGGVWKQSLTELSGGQRSLIALSLILSLLQFKPAPMYILDEVDSALDLSHTQNIGHLLKTRFKGSQFIIVSLKDGMFNNANVLFRTKFRDGVSTVDRIAQRSLEDGSNVKRDKRASMARQSIHTGTVRA